MAIVHGRFFESLPTTLALECLLTCMDTAAMVLHGHLLVEAFRAELTGKLLPAFFVQVPVPDQVSFDRETAVALCAGILLLRPVHSCHVGVHMVPRALLFSANGALELGRSGRPLVAMLRVLVHMHLAGGYEFIRA